MSNERSPELNPVLIDLAERRRKKTTQQSISNRKPFVLAYGSLTLALALVGGKYYLENRSNAVSVQDVAAVRILEAENEDFVYNIKVDSDGARLRSKPQTEGASLENRGGKVIDKLEPGTVVSRAIVVWGNDPQIPIDRSAKSRWYAFEYEGKVVFAHSHVFEPRIELYSVEPQVLSEK